MIDSCAGVPAFQLRLIVTLKSTADPLGELVQDIKNPSTHQAIPRLWYLRLHSPWQHEMPATLSDETLARPESVAIVLSKDCEQGVPEHVYHPGEVLSGELGILCEEGFIVDDILLSFEGRCHATAANVSIAVLTT